LVSLEQVAVTYQPALEQLLVLVPPDVEMLQGAQLANRDTKHAYKGLYLSFNLNLNLPPPCSTGYLPPQQVRPPSEVDNPERPARDLKQEIKRELDLYGLADQPLGVDVIELPVLAALQAAGVTESSGEPLASSELMDNIRYP
jgi:phospholipid/cholesterol/gamma-HCH transport system substrate-binding protein